MEIKKLLEAYPQDELINIVRGKERFESQRYHNWEYGYLLKDGDGECAVLKHRSCVHAMDDVIIQGNGAIYEKVTPICSDTIGRCTGMIDWEGTPIFVNDILKASSQLLGVVKFGQHEDSYTRQQYYGFYWESLPCDGNKAYNDSVRLQYHLNLECSQHYRVVGNTIDWPTHMQCNRADLLQGNQCGG